MSMDGTRWILTSLGICSQDRDAAIRQDILAARSWMQQEQLVIHYAEQDKILDLLKGYWQLIEEEVSKDPLVLYGAVVASLFASDMIASGAISFPSEREEWVEATNNPWRWRVTQKLLRVASHESYAHVAYFAVAWAAREPDLFHYRPDGTASMRTPRGEKIVPVYRVTPIVERWRALIAKAKNLKPEHPYLPVWEARITDDPQKKVMLLERAFQRIPEALYPRRFSVAFEIVISAQKLTHAGMRNNIIAKYESIKKDILERHKGSPLVRQYVVRPQNG